MINKRIKVSTNDSGIAIDMVIPEFKVNVFLKYEQADIQVNGMDLRDWLSSEHGSVYGRDVVSTTNEIIKDIQA